MFIVDTQKTPKCTPILKDAFRAGAVSGHPTFNGLCDIEVHKALQPKIDTDLRFQTGA